MKSSLKLLVAVACLIPTIALADSPLTSTGFSAAYIKKCQRDYNDPSFCNAVRQRKMDNIMGYLANDDVALDKKLAVVNSFGNSQANSYVFARTFSDLSAQDRVVLGYMVAMENFNKDSALTVGYNLASSGARQLPQSFSAQVVVALIEAQISSRASDDAWRLYSRVLKAYPANKRDMLPAAEKIIRDYMILYKK
jgi:hypothetical protein